MNRAAPHFLAQDWLAAYPAPLRQALAELLAAGAHGERRQAAVSTRERLPLPCYIAGGAVRDWRLGRLAHDLDFTLPSGAAAFARRLAARLGGAFVLLDEDEDVARVVWQGLELDFSAFRQGSDTIEEDLARRDFTINALAVEVDPVSGGLRAPWLIIDPTAGLADLAAGIIRPAGSAALADDPLRLLRAYRFRAELGFAIEPAAVALIQATATAIQRVAVERIRQEFDRIMAAPQGAAVVAEMAATGLLYAIIPELAAGAGMAQPSSHHLDVAGHALETLARMEAVLADPAHFFPAEHEELLAYLAAPDRLVMLNWAALLHDLGKPAAHRLRQGRITFYNHDRLGAELGRQVAERLRFSRERRNAIGRLIGHHMWPFHLNNSRRKTGITARACLRLIKSIGDDLPGLFLLAMADSLAGQGPQKPAGMEADLAEIYREIMLAARQRVRPLLARPPLLNGHDLQRLFGLAPGPGLARLLSGLQKAQVEGLVNSRQEAESWVAKTIDADNVGKVL